jgi:DNA-binding NtrC family response regulator
VGKDLCAFELHQRSARRDKPFIPVAMRVLSESIIESELFGHEKGAFSGADKAKVGKLEAANGGTLYIPEVSSLTETVQLKLLQFMQYKSISRVGQDSRRPDTRLDVRVIMATNEKLEEVVEKGKMREDFYHRVAGVRLTIPPLRERREDIGPLATYFLQKFAGSVDGRTYSLTPDAIRALENYRWPGNVRELENAIKGALAYSDTGILERADFPILGVQPKDGDLCRECLASHYETLPRYKAAEERFKRGYFGDLMRRADQNIARASQMAGLTGPGLRKALKTNGVVMKGKGESSEVKS